MDGYAVKTNDLVHAKEVYDALANNQDDKDKFVLEFDILGKVYAGDDERELKEQGVEHQSNNDKINQHYCTAVYITTGAVVPDGYDAVIPIEDTQHDGNSNKMNIVPSKVTSVLNTTKPWTWIRTIGCDIPPESIVLSRGEKIHPVHLALLAQVGLSLNSVQVQKLPRVGILSTGNELLDVISPPLSTATSNNATNTVATNAAAAAGKIPDVNRPLLLAQLATYANCVPVDLGIVSDDDGYQAIAQKIRHILWPKNEEGREREEGIDVLITTGGISMGEKDIMEQVFVEGLGGQVHFGRMNMKPGKPTTFITIGNDDDQKQYKKLVFALPGNPVSASVCTELLVRPCLDLLHDGVDEAAMFQREESQFAKHGMYGARVHDEVMATITSDIKLDQGRPEYRRVALERVSSPLNSSRSDQQQQYTYNATSTGVQRSSRVLSLRGADGLMMLPRGGPSGCGLDVATKGMQFPVLMYSPLSICSKTCFKDSMHRALWKPKLHNHHHPGLALGIIFCLSNGQENSGGCNAMEEIILNSLDSANSNVSVLRRTVCAVPPDASNDDSFADHFATIVSGPEMEGVNVIFVVVPTDPLSEQDGSSGIAFRASLEVSHALRPIMTKNANAMAMQVRKHAASHDPVAALFENVVGTVRDGSSVLITCSDKGLSGAVSAVGGLLGHLVSVLHWSLLLFHRLTSLTKGCQ